MPIESEFFSYFCIYDFFMLTAPTCKNLEKKKFKRNLQEKYSPIKSEFFSYFYIYEFFMLTARTCNFFWKNQNIC